MAEFMSDEDLEALKADADAEVPGSSQSTAGQVGPPVCQRSAYSIKLNNMQNQACSLSSIGMQEAAHDCCAHNRRWCLLRACVMYHAT